MKKAGTGMERVKLDMLFNRIRETTVKFNFDSYWEFS